VFVKFAAVAKAGYISSIQQPHCQHFDSPRDTCPAQTGQSRYLKSVVAVFQIYCHQEPVIFIEQTEPAAQQVDLGSILIFVINIFF
jgi:hypothetical protein